MAAPKTYRTNGPRRATCDVCEHKLAEGRVVNSLGDVECPDCGAVAEEVEA